MNKNKLIRILASVFIIFSACSLLMVSLMAMVNPQSVMDLVQVTLPNTDAYSSIRGIYGGVGLVIIIQLIYLLINNKRKALAFLCLFWGAYAVSRCITIAVDGALGDFGSQWLITESAFSIIALALYILYKKPIASHRINIA